MTPDQNRMLKEIRAAVAAQMRKLAFDGNLYARGALGGEVGRRAYERRQYLALGLEWLDAQEAAWRSG
jgi:hypothetical protein